MSQINITDIATFSNQKDKFNLRGDRIFGNKIYVEQDLTVKGNFTENIKFAENVLTDTPKLLITISDLRQYTKNNSQSVLLLGYYAPNDGGGGLFQLIDGDTTSADNGGTIIVSTVGTRWRRVIDNGAPITPKWFGARGDNVTDDSAAINATITWIFSYYSNGQPAHFKPVTSTSDTPNVSIHLNLGGYTYAISQPIGVFGGAGGCNLETFNGSLRAMSSFPSNRGSNFSPFAGPAMIFVASYPTNPYLQSSWPTTTVGSARYSNMTFRNITFWCNHYADAGIAIHQCQKTRIFDCKVYNYNYAGIRNYNFNQRSSIFITNTVIEQFIEGETVSGTYIQSGKVPPVPGIGVDCYLSQDSYIQGCFISYNRTAGINLVDSGAVVIDNCHLFGSLSCIKSSSLVADKSALQIRNCYIDQSGIDISDPGSIQISNNYFGPGVLSSSIYMRATTPQNLAGSHIIGNRFESAYGQTGVNGVGTMTLETNVAGTIANVSFDNNAFNNILLDIRVGLGGCIKEKAANATGNGYLTSIPVYDGTKWNSTIYIQTVFLTTTVTEWNRIGGQVIIEPGLTYTSSNYISGNYYSNNLNWPYVYDYVHTGNVTTNVFTNSINFKSPTGATIGLIQSSASPQTLIGANNTATQTSALILGYNNSVTGINSGAIGHDLSVTQNDVYVYGGGFLQHRFGGRVQLTGLNRPTILIGAASGTGGSVAVTLTNPAADNRGVITLVTGNTGLSAGTLVTLTFGQIWSTVPMAITAMVVSNNTLALNCNVVTGSGTWTGFTVECYTAATANTTYKIVYMCL